MTAIGGVDVCVTEFVRVSGSVLPKQIFLRTAPELSNGSKTPAGIPVHVQLLGSDPEFMAGNAARLATLGPAAIDLNFGCPAKKVNRHHGGASMLREPESLFQVVAAVRAAVPADLLVTAKMRLGYEDKSLALECAQAIERGGAGELVVHARTKMEGYRPPAHWEWIGRIADAVSISIIANGEIWTAEDYRRCREISGVADVMLGRGMVANPFLAHIIRGADDAGNAWPALLPSLRRYWDLVGAHKSPLHCCGRIKQWLNYLKRNYPEAEAAFTELKAVNCPQRIEAHLFGGAPKAAI